MPADEPLDAVLDRGSTEELVKALADHLAPVLNAPTVEEQIATVVREDMRDVGTLSDALALVRPHARHVNRHTGEQ